MALGTAAWGRRLKDGLNATDGIFKDGHLHWSIGAKQPNDDVVRHVPTGRWCTWSICQIVTIFRSCSAKHTRTHTYASTTSSESICC